MENYPIYDLKKDFAFCVPTQIIFGINSNKKINEYVIKLKIKNPLIVTDKGIVKSGLLKKLTETLELEKRNYALFDQVEINPSVQTVVKGANKYQRFFCDGIIALGGGSVIDAAKGISILVTHNKPLNYFAEKDLTINELPPLISIPTTAGTGSEVSDEAIIIDKNANYKLILKNIKLAPKVAILDPSFLGTLPSKLAAATGVESLTRAIESFISRDATILTDLLNIEAINLMGSSLRQFVADPGNLNYGAKMQLACILSTIASMNSGIGNVNIMARPLESYLDVHHGIACGVMLPHVMQWNLIANPEKFSVIAEKLGEEVNGHSIMDKAAMAVEAIQKLILDIGLPTTLTEIGIKFDIIENMAQDAIKSLKNNSNPRKTTLQDFIELYNKAL